MHQILNGVRVVAFMADEDLKSQVERLKAENERLT
jgi:hypothetical protein